jgi:hypothetical protein
MKSLHISLDIVHSGCKPINFMLSLTHSILSKSSCPYPYTSPLPCKFTFLQVDTQSSTFLRSRCTNHLNLPRLTTSASHTLNTQKTAKIHTLLSILPHIHITIICSTLCRQCRFSACIAHVSVPLCQHTLDANSGDIFQLYIGFNRNLSQRN